MPKKNAEHIKTKQLQEAKEYLRTRAICIKKGWPPVVYWEEVEIVFDMLEARTFREWHEAMKIILPDLP